MQKKDSLTKILAVIGTVLAGFPLLATILTSLLGSLRARMFHFDYLMPAELFPIAIAGGGLLLWAALRAKARRGLIAWGLGIAVGLLVGSQALAVASGLASGETEPVGLIWALVLGGIVAYALALIVIDVAGVLLVGDLFRKNVT
ncbi:MAG TPA: hypothetical protein VF823_09050 [Anaerolineales bacterium]